MDFGLVLQNDPPAWRVVDLMRRAETLGFTHAWTFDSHVLWQEPFVVYSQILSATHRIKVGPMVTNPGTRDWTVTASLFATLNDMFGNRTICGIGRGDSVVRVLGRKPTTLRQLEEAMRVLGATAAPAWLMDRLKADYGRTGEDLAVVELLLMREGRVVTKQQISEHLYGWDESASSNAVEVFIYRLRKKLEPSGVDVRTIRGMGYLIEKWPHAA